MMKIMTQVRVRGQSSRRRAHPLVLAVLVGLMWSTVAVAPAAAQAETVSVPLRSAVAELPVADETTRDGYDRDLFPHWIDEDRDGCHTRKEVLIAEATTPPEVGSRCSLVGGEWYSYYDDTTWTEQTDLDIDHVVPLAEPGTPVPQCGRRHNVAPTPMTWATSARWWR